MTMTVSSSPAILANTDAYGSGVAAAFMEACKTEEIDVPLYLSFEPVDSGAEQDLDSKLMQIKSAGLRVIMLAGQVRPNPNRNRRSPSTVTWRIF